VDGLHALVAKDANHLFHGQGTIGHHISTKAVDQRSRALVCYRQWPPATNCDIPTAWFSSRVPSTRAEAYQVQRGAGEPVEPRDLQHVALAPQLEHEVELRPGCLRTTRGVDVDVVAADAGRQQGVDLMIGVLVGGRGARLADEHLSESIGRTAHRR
jgi:hypothetical protein